MKNEHKIYAALGLLAALTGGLYLSNQAKNKTRTEHSLAAPSDLPTIAVSKEDTDKLTKIEVTTPDKDDKSKSTTVTLTKKGDDWVVTEPKTLPQGAPANAANVRSLLDNLKELKLKEAIDHGTTSYAQYEVADGKGVHMVAYKGADKAADLYFGKSGSRGQMARVGGKDGVFIASGYSGYLYTRELKNWRETSILKFEDANAVQVDVTNKSGLYSFSKNGDKWSGAHTKRDKDGKLAKAPEKDWSKFDEGKVKDLLRAYKTLGAEDFGDAKADTGLDQADQNGGVVHIKLKDNAGDITVKVGRVQKGTSRFASKDGGDGTVYVLSSWASDWATAESAKFEKGADKPGAAPPSAPPGGGMPGMGMPEENE